MLKNDNSATIVFFVIALFLIFSLNICTGHNFQTIKAINLELHQTDRTHFGKVQST